MRYLQWVLRNKHWILLIILAVPFGMLLGYLPEALSFWHREGYLVYVVILMIWFLLDQRLKTLKKVLRHDTKMAAHKNRISR